MVEERVQDLNSVTFGIFQTYFYNNLFNPDKNSKIQKAASQKNNRNFTQRTFCSWPPGKK